jgi:membrane dipeptidase
MKLPQALVSGRVKEIPDAEVREKVYKEIFGPLEVPKATIAQVADHVEHVRGVAGVDHVGLGADFDGNDSWPVGLEDVSTYPNLFAELIRRGWTEADLAKLAGGNVLRALRGAEAVAKRLQTLQPH